RESDLAIVAVKLEDIPEDTMSQIKTATIGDSDALVLGEQVVAIGNALGFGQSVTSGYVSAFNRELDLSDGYNDFVSSGLIQTDAAINSGNSGGALLNMKGELIGINEAKSAYTSSGVTVDNVGYAIPMSKAMPILEDLMNQTTREKIPEDEQGYLGVSLVNISDEFAQLYGTPQGVGFAEVAEGSPAAEAGAMKGDILTEFNGKKVSTVDEVMDEIGYYKSGEEIELTVLRADNGEFKEKKLSVTLGTEEVIKSLQSQTQ
ncbi:MAG: trypsin-like peptidase domain-containing protein, partial [Eubacterium sp.]|nr:trypsin-like peptidase domain-containing protein [Eubacterium sp.]